jgi:adenylate cyclase class IV
MEIVEIGILLHKPLEYYDELLTNAGAYNVFNCETHDVYWTYHDLRGMTEKQMKNACIRYRQVTNLASHKPGRAMMQNYPMADKKSVGEFFVPVETLSAFDKGLQAQGYLKVFDTRKYDYHYATINMRSRIQLQQIEGLGLMVYYDNPDYYHMPAEQQRVMLIRELNALGFGIPESQMGVDKLRTLYNNELCYSANQNA